MSNSDPKNWDDKKLIDLLDKTLSAHGLMKEQLHQTELELEDIVNRLADQFHDKYEDWKRKMKRQHEKGSKQYGMLTSRLIHTLGLEEGKKYICGNSNEKIKKYDKYIVNLEQQFKELNPEKISHINGKYLSEFLKNDWYKLYKKREKNYIEVFDRIKEFYEEYKSRLKSSDESGIFKNKDEENPNKYRNSYEGEVITDFMEEYIKEVDAYLNMEGYHTPLVLLKKENHKNDKIMKRHDRANDYVSKGANIPFPNWSPRMASVMSQDYSDDLAVAARTMPPGAEEWISDDDRPATPDYDPYDPPEHEGGVKVGKSPRKKTAMEIHQEKFENPNFKKRLFATKDTKVQIFEKGARKKHGAIIKKLLEDFGKGYRSRFGEPNEVDDHIIRLIRKQQKDQSKITRGDLEDVKKYRAESAENRAKAHYVYTSHRNMVERNKKMRAELLRRREILRKQDEEDSDGSSDGEIEFLKKAAEEARLMRLRDGSFMKLPPNYEGNLGKTSPVEFVDIGRSEVEMDEDKFMEYSLKRGGRRTRRRRKKLKKKTKKRKKRKRKTKRRKRKSTRKRVKAYIYKN